MADDLALDEHVRRIVGIHFQARDGAPYWLERQTVLGLDAIAEVRGARDLERLGPMDEGALRDRPLFDFVPRSQRGRLVGAIVTETGGTSGPPKRTVFSRDEFHEAFIEPFVRVAEFTGFPRGALWLWVGPSGPHIIGQAAAACAAALGSPQPFSVDFDPRWFRKLPPDSLARVRYMDHLLNQAIHILEREPVTVIFTTPAVLARLAEKTSGPQRECIRGVHYGGMRVEPDLFRAAQQEWFPNAVHLAGYGNSLFGVCMEFGGSVDRPLRYYPFGLRHAARVTAEGRICMSRLDPTVLIANLHERDAATPLAAPGHGPPGFGPGIEDPRPIAAVGSSDAGIY
jgi:thienamycin biosynthesis protein ThnN